MTAIQTYSELITKLAAIITAGVMDLKAVYTSYPNGPLSVFPCAIVMPSGRTSEFLSTRDTRRKVTIFIRIYGSLDNTEVNTQIKIRDVADKVTNVLEKNITLDSTIEWSQPISDKFAFDSKTNNLYYNEITYVANVRFNRAA